MPTRMFAGSFFLIHSGSVLCKDLREAPEHPRSARKRPFGPSAAVYSSLDGETFSSYPSAFNRKRLRMARVASAGVSGLFNICLPSRVYLVFGIALQVCVHAVLV